MSQPIADKISTADALRAEMTPSGLLQNFLVGQIGLAMDRLARADAREDRDGPADPAWARAQAQAERAFYRALTEFRRLAKAEAKARADAEPKVARAPKPAPSRAVAAPTNRRPVWEGIIPTPVVGQAGPRHPSPVALDAEPRRAPSAAMPPAARAG